ncbi:hypothetical protein [Sphingomonas sp. RS2018]
MQRPPSIVAFERCYLGAWVIGLGNTMLGWGDVQANPDVVSATQQLGGWFLPTITAIYFAVPLVLWYLIARQGSVIAKWVLTICTALWTVWVGLSLGGGAFTATTETVVTLLSFALTLVATYLMFRPDTRAWFDDGLEDVE